MTIEEYIERTDYKDIRKALREFKNSCNWSKEEKEKISTNYMTPYRWKEGISPSRTHLKALRHIVEGGVT